MPEEGKPEVESDCKIVKDHIYVDSKVVDNFLIKGGLENFILSDCDDRVLLLMESDCSTEDLMMEDGTLSDWSNEILFEGENVSRSTVVDEEVNADVSVSELSGGRGHEGESDLCQFQVESKATKVTNAAPSSVTADRDSRECSRRGFGQYSDHHDAENENMISYRSEIDDEFHESGNIMQHYSGTIPYSGSISLRSTSSTASTQSFAFPVLAQDWSSSPVRMPKPNKRRLQQPKHWKIKMCCVCCKF